MACVVLQSGCSNSVDLGSHLLWHADHEEQGLDPWRGLEGAGGSAAAGALSEEHAHSGKASLRIDNDATGVETDVGVGFDFNERREAYFSAWYYVEEAYATLASWSIMRFWSRGDACGDLPGLCAGVDVQLRTLPGGQVVIELYNSDRAFLRPPLPDPPVYVPVREWFHIEVLFRRATDPQGRFYLWVDGKPVYGFERWRTAEIDNLFWTVSNTGRTAGTSTLYVDDAAISLIPMTPTGVTTLP